MFNTHGTDDNNLQPVCDRTDSYVSFTPLAPDATSTARIGNALLSIATYAGGNWSSLLLLFVPFGVLAPVLGWGDSAVFVLNCIAVIPLADVLCRATDDVANFMGETLGALLNITMGNATELVILYVLSIET
jgi:Ca2+:H+ antiporter